MPLILPIVSATQKKQKTAAELIQQYENTLPKPKVTGNATKVILPIVQNTQTTGTSSAQTTPATSLTMSTTKGKRKVANNTYFAYGIANQEQQRTEKLADSYSEKAAEIGRSITAKSRSRSLTKEERADLTEQKEQAEEEAAKYKEMSRDATAEAKTIKDQAKLNSYESLRSKDDFWTWAQRGEREYTSQANAKAKEDEQAQPWLTLSNPDSLGVPQSGDSPYYTSNADRIEAMTAQEKGLYYYLLAKQGQDAADEYMSLLNLNARIGSEEADTMQSIGMGGLVAPMAGFESALSGTAQAIAAPFDYTLPTTSLQYASQDVRQDLGNVPGALYDIAYTAGNMAPSIALSNFAGGMGAVPKLAQGIGALSFGVSSSGNYYKQAIDEGYSHNQAMAYGYIKGALEGGLQYLLGGIGKLGLNVIGGKLEGTISKALTKIIKNEKVVQAITQVTAGMPGEAIEEYLQDILDPVVRNMVYDEQNEVKLYTPEALYSAMLGAFTSALFGGADVISLRGTQTPTQTAVNTDEQVTAPTAENTTEASAQAVDTTQTIEQAETPAAENVTAENPTVDTSSALDVDLPTTENPDVIVVGDMAVDKVDGVMMLPRKATQEEIASARHSAEPIETVMQRNAETSADMQHFNQLSSEMSMMEYDPAKVYTSEDYKSLVNKSASEYTADDIMMLTKALAEKKGLYLKDVTRVLDTASGGNRQVRQALYNLIEKPFNQAGGQYGRRVDNQLTSYDSQMRNFGITPNSAEDAAVMKYGEGQYTDADGTVIPYTIDDLKAEFPTKWENIVEADKLNRKMYDSYLNAINTMRESIYPKLVEYAQGEIDAAKTRYQTLKTKQQNQQAYINKMLENIKAKEELAASKKRTDTKAYTTLQNSLATLNERLIKARDKLASYERKIADTEFKIQTSEKAVADGDILGQKKIAPRKDYYHHVRELSSAFDLAGIFSNKGAASELATTGVGTNKSAAGGLGSIIDNLIVRRRGSSEISPELVGTSDYTTPKTKWEGILEQRRGGRYQQSAYAGMTDYISTAEFMLAHDPLTAYYRSVDSAMMKAATASNTKNSNSFREWFKDWTNILTGKSDNILDRGVQKLVGRNVLNGLNNLNSLVKSSTLLYNVRSAVVQISNIPNAMQYLPNPKDWVTGAYYLANAARGDVNYASVLRQSDFMSQRYMTSADDIVQTVKTKIQKPGAKMLEAGQKFGDLLTWWAAYAKYQNNTNTQDAMFRDYSSAIDYADDITRRSVAGRGIGEVPLALQSKTANIFTPFQIEVTNQYNAIKEHLDKAFNKQYTLEQRSAAAAGIVQYEIGAFLFNAATRALFGDDILGFDFIHVLTDAIKDLTDDDKDESVIGNVVQNTLGTIAEGVPFTSFVVPLLIGSDASEKLFGADRDPSRYGTGTLGTNAVAKAATFISDAAQGNADLWDAADVAANFIPFGGRQLLRTAKGVSTVAQGGSYKQDEEGNPQLQFRTDQGVKDYLQGGLFGKWALPQAREYVESGFPVLSAADTKAYQDATAAGIDGTDFLVLRGRIKDYTTDRDEDGNITQSATQKARDLIMQQDLTPEQKALIDQELLRRTFTADYSDETMFELSQLGQSAYERAQENISNGMSEEDALMVEQYREDNQFDPIKNEQGETVKTSTERLREYIYNDKSLTTEQKTMIDKAIIGGEYTPDYSSRETFTTDRTEYEKKTEWKKQGYSQAEVDTFYKWYQKKGSYSSVKDASGKTISTSTDRTRAALMSDTSLSAAEKAKIDSAVIGNTFTYDYTSKATYSLCEMGESVYNRAKEIVSSDSRITYEDTLKIAQWWENNGTGDSRKERLKKYLFNTMGYGKNRVWTVLQAYNYKTYD